MVDRGWYWLVVQSSSIHKVMISVVTVVKDDVDGLDKTFTSCRCQSINGWRGPVVVDGVSADGTSEFAANVAAHCEVVTSEPDFGIYDAMNKGARIASGDWVVFMNAGDTFFDDGVLADLEKHCHDGCDIVLGETIKTFRDELGTREFHESPRARSQWWKGMPCCHQSMVVRREWLLRYPFNLQFRWCADFDQFARMVRAGARINAIPLVVARYDANGADGRSIWIYIRERFQISRMLAPRWKRWPCFAVEVGRVVISAPLLSVIRRVIPTKWILRIRHMRGTEGINSSRGATT